MRLHVFEARTAGVRYGNWGKFAVGLPGPREWAWTSALPRDEQDPPPVSPAPIPLLREIGWTARHVWVLDLQTGEGAYFRHGGNAHADLDKHQIWVCPLYEPFLTWLYRQDLAALDTLPRLVELDAEFTLHGYRRPGPTPFYDRQFRQLWVLPGPGVCQLHNRL